MATVVACEAGKEKSVMDKKWDKKLDAEELEKRVAPATLYVDDGSGSGTQEQTKGQKAPGKDAKV